MLSAPTIGALAGIGIVLCIGVVARRGEQRAQAQRLRIIRERIERRQAALAREEKSASASEAVDEPKRQVDE